MQAYNEARELAESKMRERYEIKMRGILGPEPGDMKAIEILNRTVAWKDDFIEYRADKKHAELLMAEFGLNEKSNGVDCPGVREADGENDAYLLDGVEAKRFRGMAWETAFVWRLRREARPGGFRHQLRGLPHPY